ncbi:ATP-binding protein [Enterococcus thailandicus]|uniref:ATP-binding protein n=1 Tax=Enterococcus thailandicus TaxID=417368 RepID=UPI0022E80EDC|nr:AAA family ATPase [Enterococcus thailandicus]
MKILQIEINAFGKWRQKSFDFSSGNQLIYGENEAGKSTVYQFIQAILFGFPSKGRKKKDYTPKDGAAYGGRVWFEHPVHGEFMVERYKQQNRGKAKVVFGEQTGSEILLGQLISPLTRELFQQVFTFQQEQLSELDHLREKELHDMLISLGITGSSQVFQKRQEYYNQAQNLYKKKGQKLLINQKLNSWKSLQEKIYQKQAQEDFFSQLVMQEQAAKKKQDKLRQELSRNNEKLLQLNQQKINFSLYEEWQELQENTLNELPSEQLLTDLQEFSSRYQQMSERLEELESTLEKHSGMDQQSARYYFFLEQETELKALLKEQTQVEQLVNEWQRLQVETRETEAELKILEQRWGWQRQNQPVEFQQSPEWKTLFSQNRQFKEEDQQLTIRLQIAKEQQELIDAEISQLEARYPFLLQNQQMEKKKRNSIPYMVAGGVFIVLGLLLPFPWKIISLLGGAGLVGSYFLNKEKDSKSNSLEVKGMWQEKLGQLDVASAQIAEVEENRKQNQRMQQQLDQQVQYLATQWSLKQLNTVELMKEYGQEVTDYQRLCAIYERKQKREREIQEKLLFLEQKFDVVQEWLPVQDKLISEKMDLLAQFVQEMEQMKFARSYQQNTLLTQEINQLKKKQKAWLQEYTQQLNEAQLAYPSEVPLFLQKAHETIQKKERLAELSKIVTPLFPEKMTRVFLEQEIIRLDQLQRQRQLEEKAASEQQQRLSIQVEELQKDGTLDELYQEESRQKAELEHLMVQWGAYEVAGTFLGDLSTEMSERQLPQLLKEATYYFGLLTDGKYQRILLKEDLLTLTDGKTEFPIYELSTGTKDQLIMAMRFAYLSLEANRALCPVIIDDGWLHYDSHRKYYLAKLLAEFGKKYQIICFSSDKEMLSYYQELQQSVKRLEGA